MSAYKAQLFSLNYFRARVKAGMRLKTRVKGIPNGLRFQIPEINWNSVNAVGRHPSWETLVNAVIAARNANPHHRDKHKWSVDVETVADEVDAYNTKICLDNGWNNYVAVPGGGALPPRPPSSASDGRQLSAAVSAIKKLWTGLKTTGDWLDSNEPPVALDLAENRAATCVACPKNEKAALTDWFTVPASKAIERQLVKLHSRNIATSQDASLFTCSACLCPLQLKVHTPLNFIQPNLSSEVIASLRNGRDCWILKESGLT